MALPQCSSGNAMRLPLDSVLANTAPSFQIAYHPVIAHYRVRRLDKAVRGDVAAINTVCDPVKIFKAHGIIPQRMRVDSAELLWYYSAHSLK
jgi:hypothetical protein